MIQEYAFIITLAQKQIISEPMLVPTKLEAAENAHLIKSKLE